MKNKVTKKLEFNKKVITELDNSTLKKINGGTATQIQEEDFYTRYTSRLCRSGIV